MEKINLLTKIQKKLKFKINTNLIDNGFNEPDFSFELKKLVSNREFSPFSIKGIKGIIVFAEINNIDKGLERRILSENEEISEDSLISELEQYSKSVKIEQVDFITIAKRLIKKPIVENGIDIYEIKKNNLSEKEFQLISNDIVGFIDNFIRDYSIEKNTKKLPLITIFPDVDNVDLKFKFSKSVIDSYQIYEVYLLDDLKSVLKEDREGNCEEIFDFQISDEDNNLLKCQISKNVEYFDRLEIKRGAFIRIEGMLRFSNGIPFLDVYFIRFKNQPDDSIEILLDISNGTQYYLVNDNSGVYYRANKKDGGYLANRCFFKHPISIIDKYSDGEEEIFEIRIGPYQLSGTSEEILNQLKKGYRQLLRARDRLEDIFNYLLSEISKKHDIKEKKIYRYPGIHLTDTHNFEIVMPQLKKIKWKHITHKEEIGSINASNLFLPKDTWVLKSDEEIAELKIEIDNAMKWYSRYLNLSYYQENNILVAAFNTITPFFKAIAQIEPNLDSYLALFLVGDGSKGKSTSAEITNEHAYGIKKKLADKIGSQARFINYMGASTIPLFWDDIHNIDTSKPEGKVIVGTLKGFLTDFGDTIRLNNSDGGIEKSLVRTILGTANRLDWLESEGPLRDGRTIILEYSDSPKEEDKERFDKVFNELVITKGLGWFILSLSIEYIRLKAKIEYNREDMTDHEILITMIRNKGEEIRELCRTYKIFIGDSRRITLYSVLLIGIEFLRYSFSLYGNEPISLMNEFLELKSEKLARFIKKCEDKNFNIKKKNLEHFRVYLESIDFREQLKKVHFDYSSQEIFVTGFGISEYDQWAISHGYRQYQSLDNLSKIIREILPNYECKQEHSEIIWSDNSRTRPRFIRLPYEKIFEKKFELPEGW